MQFTLIKILFFMFIFINGPFVAHSEQKPTIIFEEAVRSQNIFENQINKKKVILITGATGGLGTTICDYLASKGYSLILTARNLQSLRELKESLEQKYKGSYVIKTLDFNNQCALKSFVQTIDKASLSGVVLITPRPKLRSDSLPKAEEWLSVLSETFIMPHETLRLLDGCIQDGGGIVLLSGITSKMYKPAHPHRNVIRLAWLGAMKNLSHFFGKRNIRVNTVSPGIILTDYHKTRIEERARQNSKSFDEQLEGETRLIPLKKYGNTQDVVSLVYFLLSDNAKHLNSVNIPLDGGEANTY